MPTYRYKAKRGPDKTVEGEIVADSPPAAVARLDAMGVSPVWVRESRGSDGTEGRSPRPRRVASRDVTVFTYQLASLVKAGVPILRALSTVAEQTESTAMRMVVEAVRRRVQDGGMLSEALHEHPQCFAPLYINMVRAGESAGLLDTVMLRLAETREREETVRRQVQTAMAYPMLILAVGAATVFMLLAFFLPRVASLFRDVRDLPMPTRILLWISDGVREGWPWILLAMGLLLAVLNRLTALDRGRLAVDRLKLRVPGVGRFLLHVDLARLARTLGLLLEAGVAIDRALALCAGVVRNRALRKGVEEIQSLVVQQGLAFASGVRRTRMFPPLFANMTAVGEEAGRLDAALLDVAAYYERDCEQRGRMATSLLEPALILVVGAMVGFIVAAMLLPVFRLTSGLR